MRGILIPPHQLVYWVVPKNACTTMSRRIAEILEIPLGAATYDNAAVHVLPFTWVAETPAGYTSFALVRHPLLRLYSLFNERILVDGRTAGNYTRGIECNVFGRWLDRLHCQMSFSEFVHVVLTIPPADADEHFVPQSTLIPAGALIYKLELVSPLLRVLAPTLNQHPHKVPWQTAYDADALAAAVRYYVDDFQRFNYAAP